MPGDRISPREVASAVEHAVLASPAYEQLDESVRRDLADSLEAVTSYLRSDPLTPSLSARQLAPDLSGLRRTSEGAGSPQPASAGVPVAPNGSGAPASAGPTGRVGELARSTLNAIDFPSFVSGLIQGTFQAIVDSSIQQMTAYAEMLKQVATTVDQFMAENVSDGMARDYLSDRYGDVLTRDTSGGSPKLAVKADAGGADELPSFFGDLGFTSPADLTEDQVEDVVVPAARRSLAEQRQQTLATMVLMGINRVVVNDGDITAKLVFHIDASETTDLKFDQTKTTAGTMARTAGTSPFTAQAVMVNTVNVNAQSDVNIRTDLTGQVTVRFRSETFPLERFADSYAIQLINSNAKVPPPPATAPTTGGATASNGQAPVAAPPSPATGPAPATGQSLSAPAPWQSLPSQDDPWAPGG